MLTLPVTLESQIVRLANQSGQSVDLFLDKLISKTKTYPFFVILVFLSFSAVAQLNKCQIDGKTVYQDGPCEGAIEIDTSRLADESAQAAKRRQKEQAELALHPRKLVIGMSSRDVLKAWGRPAGVNRSVYPGHINEQWVYHSKRYAHDRYAYIDNGFLTSYQQ